MQRFVGIPAGTGFAIGEAFVLDRRRIRVPQRRIALGQIEAECSRFRAAVEATDEHLGRLRDKLSAVGGDTLILEAHRLISTDPYIVDRVLATIRERRINAEWALQEVVREVKKVFAEVDDRYFAERRSDVDFGARHLWITLLGRARGPSKVPPGAIVVARDLTPADVAQLYRDQVRAVVAELGGPASHAVIMARSLGLVGVVGVRGVVSAVASGDSLIVDGKRGEVFVQPDTETVADYREQIEYRERRLRDLADERDFPAETIDGVRVRMLANVGLPEELPVALEQGIDGIGLCRSDCLYLGRDAMPTEDEHAESTRYVLDACGDLPVCFRTYDLSGELAPAATNGSEANPAIGLRGIRLSLQSVDLFRSQLRGLLRGAAGRSLRVMFPMVSSLGEVRQAKAVLASCARDLGSAGPREIKVGITVETPAAALMAGVLAEDLDFFAVGTNDLIQYVIGVDRANERVSHLYQPLHPAVLKLVQCVVRAGADAGIPVSVCGEMAGEPRLALLLVGIGVRELSMSPASVGPVRQLIRAACHGDAVELAAEAMRMATAEEVEALVASRMEDLFPGETFAGSLASTEG